MEFFFSGSFFHAGQAEAAVPEALTSIQAATLTEGGTPVAVALAVVLEAEVVQPEAVQVVLEVEVVQPEAVQVVKSSFAGGNFLLRAGLCSQHQRVPSGADA